ncbi:MAG: GNAT family N-acetyltransferase [Clostridium sp.]|uniref:GNAT family N-acetyltransferase n=1 Tax=Clostridium sp. TaxID=1506 RepID=UPI002FC60692
MNFIVRDANINDYKDVSSLVKEVHQLHVENRPDIYLPVEVPLNLNKYKQILENKESFLFVIEDVTTNQVVAYSIIQIVETKNLHLLKPNKCLFIDDLCVKSSNQKSGLGRLLFNHIVEYAKLINITSIQLTVSEFNSKAIRFYESCGMNTRNRKMELHI